MKNEILSILNPHHFDHASHAQLRTNENVCTDLARTYRISGETWGRICEIRLIESFSALLQFPTGWADGIAFLFSVLDGCEWIPSLVFREKARYQVSHSIPFHAENLSQPPTVFSSSMPPTQRECWCETPDSPAYIKGPPDAAFSPVWRWTLTSLDTAAHESSRGFSHLTLKVKVGNFPNFLNITVASVCGNSDPNY